MGQYFFPANLSKNEKLDPHVFGNGLKAREFAFGGLTNCAVSLLLVNSNGMGAGDWKIDDLLVGSWAGDNIVYCGDYSPIYQQVREFKDISFDVLKLLLTDNSCKEQWINNIWSIKTIENMSDDLTWLANFFSKQQLLNIENSIFINHIDKIFSEDPLE